MISYVCSNQLCAVGAALGESADKAGNFLAKAKEAEEQAARSKDETARLAWQTIAERYRGLAKQTPETPH